MEFREEPKILSVFRPAGSNGWNAMTDASQLLRAYVAESSEEAFRSLVEHHISLVYSTALRVVCGDATLAKDVTQIVFTDLARKAQALPAKVVLSGWLYRHTTFVASKLLRSESRRRSREKEAVIMNAPDESEAVWNQLTPLLDSAIGSLSARDRDAVVMRYFEKQDFRSLAAALHLTEDAAQKRVARALEKLRHYFPSGAAWRCPARRCPQSSGRTRSAPFRAVLPVR